MRPQPRRSCHRIGPQSADHRGVGWRRSGTLIGKTLSHYRIVRELGRGGMGVVYEAEDESLGRRVALKMLGDGAVSGGELMERRFEREARLAASLNHPNICSVFELGEAEGSWFLAMELLEGDALSDWLGEQTPTIEQILAFSIQIASALELAHNERIIHRDLKPANVFVTADGSVKLVDFGLAKRVRPVLGDSQVGVDTELTTPGMIVGTVAYMSPEQARGDEVDVRSDLFSLGTILYQMATFALPFQGETSSRMFESLLTKAPIAPRRLNPALPVALEQIIYRALQKDPAQRYQSASELLVDLRRVPVQEGAGTDGSGSGRPPAPPQPNVDTAAGTLGGAPVPSALVPPTGALVGRQDELARLEAVLRDAFLGRGAMVAIGGEAGIGKSSLCLQLSATARDRGGLVFTGRCQEIGGAQPYLPFIEIFGALVRSLSVDELREILGADAAAVAKVLPELGRLLGDFPPTADLPPDQERRMLFNALTDSFARAAGRRPLLLVLEDLQWADEATLLLLRFLGQRLVEMPFLLVTTYRATDLEPISSVMAAITDVKRVATVERVSLRRLGEEAVEQILLSLAGQPAPPAIVRTFFRTTDGNPFFVEELYRHLAEEGQLFDRHGHWRSQIDIDERALPEGVGLVIGRRLERLSSDGRKVLTAAAVLASGGFGFSLRLLEALGEVDDEVLLDVIDESEHSDLLRTGREEGEIVARFTHDLIRQTLLSRVSLLRLERLHLRVATAIEELFPHELEARAEDLAHHLESAGARAEPSKVVHYLKIAARKAATALAFEDGLRFLGAALETTGRMPPGPERDQLELDLQMARAAPLSVTKGYGAPELEALHRRARELSQRIGDAPLPLLAGLWRFFIIRGLLPSARDLAQQLVTDAEEGQQPPAVLLNAHRALGCTLTWQGELAGARDHMERAIAIYEGDPEGCRHADEAEDVLVFCQKERAWSLWFLGYPDQSVAQIDAAIERARTIEHPFSEAAARTFACYIRLMRREVDETMAEAEAVLALSRQHGFPFWEASAGVIRGWVLAQRGRHVDAIHDIGRAIEAWGETGSGAAVSFFQLLLAEVFAGAGRTDDALATLEAAEEEIDRRGERLIVAEVHRLRGRLHWSRDDGEKAEGSLRTALAITREQGARSLELRAAVELARIDQPSAGSSSARAELASVYERFTEGFETPDLVAARALLS